jgi:tripartite-type tricarboxylate transporter receptor subunit TctC
MSRSSLRRNVLKAVAAVAASVVLPVTMAQAAWPERPVTFIVPFSAGGTTDIVARLVGQRLGMLWHQSVIVEDRPGAGGNIGAGVVAKAAPDGYTLLVPSGSILTVNPYIYKSMGFDPKKDLLPITNIAQGPMIVVVNPSVPAKNLKELIALAKAKPGTLNFGSAGVGSQVHMAGENFADAARIDIRHIPYKGEAMGLNDLMGGQIQLMVGNIAAASNYVKAGKLRALAVTGKERSAMLPDVPTAQEAGLPGFVSTGWFGLMAPAGTPRAIIDKIQHDVAEVLKNPDVQKALAQQGMEAVGSTPDQLAHAITEESRKWQQVVANRHIKQN